MKLLRKYISDTFLYKVAMACTKMAKLEISNTQLLVCFETDFCVPWPLCILHMRGFGALPSTFHISPSISILYTKILAEKLLQITFCNQTLNITNVCGVLNRITKVALLNNFQTESPSASPAHDSMLSHCQSQGQSRMTFTSTSYTDN